MSSGTVATCGFCGRPVQCAVYLGGTPYHAECTQCPTPQHYVNPSLTESDIRRIVREELERAKP